MYAYESGTRCPLQGPATRPDPIAMGLAQRVLGQALEPCGSIETLLESVDEDRRGAVLTLLAGGAIS